MELRARLQLEICLQWKLLQSKQFAASPTLLFSYFLPLTTNQSVALTDFFLRHEQSSSPTIQPSVRLLLQSPSAYKMPRLVRRRPLWERITSNLNPMDFLLWLSEELETRDWDSKLVGTQLGLAMNLVFLLARANAGATSSSSDNDIFGDETKIGWFSYVVSISFYLTASQLVARSQLTASTKGLSHCMGSRTLLLHQRSLHLHANAKIPNVPSQHRRASIHAFCATSPGSVVPRDVCLTASILRRQDRTGLG